MKHVMALAIAGVAAGGLIGLKLTARSDPDALRRGPHVCDADLDDVCARRIDVVGRGAGIAF